MVRPAARSKTIGAKVTAEEYALLESRAGNRSLSEWVRETLLAAVDRPPTPTEEAVLSEVLALRMIVLNVVFELAKKEAVSAEAMQELIAQADGGKRQKALDHFHKTRRP